MLVVSGEFCMFCIGLESRPGSEDRGADELVSHSGNWTHVYVPSTYSTGNKSENEWNEFPSVVLNILLSCSQCN